MICLEALAALILRLQKLPYIIFPPFSFYIRFMSPRYFLALAALLFFTCSLSAQEKNNTLLWRVTGKGLDKPSYLFGTFHLNDNRLFQFGDSVYAAMDRTEGLAVEVDLNEMAAY
ncbi:MAG: hypothetical protein EOP49_46755, partial [Sphingobacteriales bacterium]